MHRLAVLLPQSVQFNGIGPLGTVAAGSQGTMLENVISAALGLVTILGGLWFLFQLFIGAFNWISAGADKNALERAQKRITNAIIGLFLVVFAYGLTAIIGLIFGIEILNPNKILPNLHP